MTRQPWLAPTLTEISPYHLARGTLAELCAALAGYIQRLRVELDDLIKTWQHEAYGD